MDEKKVIRITLIGVVAFAMVIILIATLVPIVTNTYNNLPIYEHSQEGDGFVARGAGWVVDVEGKEYVTAVERTLWQAGDTEEEIGYTKNDKTVEKISPLKNDPNRDFLCLEMEKGYYVWRNLYCSVDIPIPQLDEQTVSQIESYYGQHNSEYWVLEKSEMKAGTVTVDKEIIKVFTEILNDKEKYSSDGGGKFLGQLYFSSGEYPMLTYITRIIRDDDGIYYADVFASGDKYVEVPADVAEALMGEAAVA